LVPDYYFFCKKCKDAGKDDGLLELIKNLPNNYSDWFGEIIWVDGGQGYGYWPAVVLDPMETSGKIRAQYRKILGSKFVVGLFECSSSKHLMFLQESQLVTWNDGKLRGFCDGILAKEKSDVQLDIFKRAFKIADDEVLAQYSLGKNLNQDSCDGIKSIDPATLLTSPPTNKDDSQTSSPYCSSDDDSDQYLWPPEEYYTVYDDDFLDETHEEDLIRGLNIMKDNPRTKVNIKRMKQFTSTLRDAEKKGKIKSRGGHDYLDDVPEI